VKESMANVEAIANAQIVSVKKRLASVLIVDVKERMANVLVTVGVQVVIAEPKVLAP